MNNKLIWTLMSVIVFFSLALNAQNEYKITVNLDNYEEENLYLGYHLGGKQYLTDTTKMDDKGNFVFSKIDSLESGLYLIVMEPEHKYFEFIIDEYHPKLKISVDANQPFESIKFEGSKVNSDYYDYLHFFSKVRKDYEALSVKQSMELKDTDAYKDLDVEKEKIKLSSFAYQDNIIETQPKSFLSMILLANKTVDMPSFEGTAEEKQMSRYLYAKSHYFDYINLKDNRLLRTPFLNQKLNYFIDKMTPQHPDSVIVSVDNILERMDESTDLYQYYVVKYLNQYANSKFVGFDAVYVHIANKYYASGRTPWVSKEGLAKITKQAKVLKNLLIGTIAPNIELERKDKSRVSLHDVDKEYTVLFFWSPNCGHCKKSMPSVLEFYEKFNNKGVEIFAVCTLLTDKTKECWEYIDEKESGMNNWMNLVDPYLRSRYKQIYDVKSTPTIYILDKDKKILSKRIGSEQLEEVMLKLMERKEKELEESKKAGKS